MCKLIFALHSTQSTWLNSIRQDLMIKFNDRARIDSTYVQADFALHSTQNIWLTLSRTANFKLFQAKRVCRQQFQI